MKTKTLWAIAALMASMLLVRTGKAAEAAEPIGAHWLVTADLHGTPIYGRLDIERQGRGITGRFYGDKIEGSLEGSAVHFVAKDNSGGTSTVDATLKRGVLSGTVVETDAADESHSDRYSFTAIPIRQEPRGAPTHHEFTPTVFYREFSAANKPVLSLSPGDSIHTTTVDAGGTDREGHKRVLGGNPQTGPFYIESAMPGDTLVVHLNRLRLNRDYAISDDGVVGRGTDNYLAVKMKDAGKTVLWHLDIAQGLASLEKPGAHMAGYTVPVHPMLGCVGTAPAPSRGAPPTGDSGSYGGNMDFNEIVEGATIYLPVSVPGALLYLGDGHAAQGDGELNGNALETSLDVEFTVDLLPGRRTPGPRVESDTHIMAMGLGGSIDDAFKSATANMAGWIAEDYKLLPAEIAELFGTSAEYRVSEVADRNAGVVLKISKERLKSLTESEKK
ncbi:MAG TPA: acetamidase/formamidase family protein [Steroidobacteraceae bacterium]